MTTTTTVKSDRYKAWERYREHEIGYQAYRRLWPAVSTKDDDSIVNLPLDGWTLGALFSAEIDRISLLREVSEHYRWGIRNIGPQRWAYIEEALNGAPSEE